jgi:serine protease Do
VAHETRNPRYIALLAVLAAVMLLVGLFLKPRPIVTESAPLPSQTEISRLRLQAQRTSLDSMADYLGGVAENLERHIVYLANDRTSGLVWDSGLVVAPRLTWQFPGWEAVSTAAGDIVAARTTISGPTLPLAALQAPDIEGLPPVPRQPEMPPQTSDWLLAIWRDEDEHIFAPGLRLGSSTLECGESTLDAIVTSLALTRAMAGGGVFDLDANLRGVILPCGEGYAALTLSSVDALLQRGGSFEFQLLASYGMRTGALDEAEQSHFDLEHGAIVREVWRGYRADLAGLQPGDVILELNGQPVISPDELNALLLPEAGETHTVGIKRGPRSRQIELTPAAIPVPEGDGGVGLAWDSPPPGYDIGSVLPGSPAAQADLQPGDRLLRLDHVAPRNLAHLRQLLSRRGQRAVLLELERAGKRWAVLLP